MRLQLLHDMSPLRAGFFMPAPAMNRPRMDFLV